MAAIRLMRSKAAASRKQLQEIRMREIKKWLMALLLVAVAEMPESAFAGVASPISATPILSGLKEDGTIDKAAYRFCRYTYWGKRCGGWHYGYYRRHRRHYYWHRRLVRYCRYTYYGKVCGRWH
jgi:hypothetical protein